MPEWLGLAVASEYAMWWTRPRKLGEWTPEPLAWAFGNLSSSRIALGYPQPTPYTKTLNGLGMFAVGFDGGSAPGDPKSK